MNPPRDLSVPYVQSCSYLMYDLARTLCMILLVPYVRSCSYLMYDLAVREEAAPPHEELLADGALNGVHLSLAREVAPDDGHQLISVGGQVRDRGSPLLLFCLRLKVGDLLLKCVCKWALQPAKSDVANSLLSDLSLIVCECPK